MEGAEAVQVWTQLAREQETVDKGQEVNLLVEVNTGSGYLKITEGALPYLSEAVEEADILLAKDKSKLEGGEMAVAISFMDCVQATWLKWGKMQPVHGAKAGRANQ